MRGWIVPHCQVHRHARRAVDAGKVAGVGVIGDVGLEEFAPALAGSGLADLGQRHAVRDRSVGNLVGSPVGPDPRDLADRRSRLAPAVVCPDPEERREDAVRGAVGLHDPARRHGVGRSGAHQIDAVLGERLFDVVIALGSVRGEVGRDMHGVGTCGAGDAHHLVGRDVRAPRAARRCDRRTPASAAPDSSAGRWRPAPRSGRRAPAGERPGRRRRRPPEGRGGRPTADRCGTT